MARKSALTTEETKAVALVTRLEAEERTRERILAIAKAEIEADKLKGDAALQLRRQEIEADIRVALEQAKHDAAHAAMPLDDEARAHFLRLLAAGMPVFDICQVLQVSRTTVYWARNHDDEFAERWTLALEQRYTPVEDRLANIALKGSPDSMATVRAAEVLLKGGIRRYGPPPPKIATATLTSPDGRSISVQLGGAPLPS